jgi:hypothetical protein
MNQERHPDIEVYVKSCPVPEIEAWLSTLGTVTSVFAQGVTHEYNIRIDEIDLPVLIHEKVVGKAWTSIWFKSDRTPWSTDLECARAAAAGLETQVRCIAGGWSDGDDPDEWWKLDQGTETLIQWVTS